MITIKYKLNKDIIARTAANFVWELNNCESSIYVINNNRKINGKSLIGVLSG
jgi:phosphotransferase system HPr-like phosphotransfer protein